MKRSVYVLAISVICLFVATSCAPPPNLSTGGSPALVTNTQPELLTVLPTSTATTEDESQPTYTDAHSRIAENPVLQKLTTSFSARQFTLGEVPRHDIETILLSGARAQSARNAQPWRFTVVTNYDDVRQMHSNAAVGNIVIIISGRIDNVLPTTEFDCGIAAAYMQIAGEALGYGVRMLVSPVSMIESRRDDFGIPEGYRVIMAIIIGTADDALDGFTSATPRNALDDIVNWVD